MRQKNNGKQKLLKTSIRPQQCGLISNNQNEEKTMKKLLILCAMSAITANLNAAADAPAMAAAELGGRADVWFAGKRLNLPIKYITHNVGKVWVNPDPTIFPPKIWLYPDPSFFYAHELPEREHNIVTAIYCLMRNGVIKSLNYAEKREFDKTLEAAVRFVRKDDLDSAFATLDQLNPNLLVLTYDVETGKHAAVAPLSLWIDLAKQGKIPTFSNW
jgi:hypothetical protein